MQHRWLKITLIFSLIINVAAIVFVLTLWNSEPKQKASIDRPPRERPSGPPSWIRPEREEAVTKLMQEYGEKIQSVRQELWTKRSELIDVLREENPDTAKIMHLIEALSVYQTKLEKITARHLLDLKPNLDPEKKDIFIKIFEERMMQYRDRRRESDHGKSKPDTSSVSWNKSYEYFSKKAYGHFDQVDESCKQLDKSLNTH